MASYATRLMDSTAAPAIEVRPSTDDDVPAMLAIYHQHVAHGVVGHIIPWNYPAQMFGRT